MSRTMRPCLILVAVSVLLAVAFPVHGATGEAEDLFRRGEYGRAAELFTVSLGQGPGSPLEEGRLHFNLGVCRLRQGRLAEAEYSLRRAVLLIDGSTGGDSAEAAAAREGLATVLLAQGNTMEAREVLGRSLAVRERLFGADHPQTLRSLDLLASTHWIEGDAEQALALYERVMAGLRAIHGNVHPLTATTAQNIGAVQLEISSDWTAEIMFRQAAYIVEVLHGAGHPEALAPLCGMGDIFARAGLLDRADGYYRRALDAISANPSNAADTAREHVQALEGLARVLIAQDRPAEALPLLREAAARHDDLRVAAGGDIEAATFGGSPRPLLAHALLLLGKGEEAWSVLEGGRGRLLSAWRTAGDDSLRLGLLDLEAKLATADDEATRLCLNDEWNELDARRTALLATRQRSADPRLGDLQQVLRENDLVIGWLDAPLAEGRRATWVYTMERGRGLAWQRLPDAPWAALPRHLAQLREALLDASAWDDSWRAEADTVWTARLAPAAAQIDRAERLLVVVAAPMSGVPLGPLGPAGEPALVERCRVLAAATARDFSGPAAAADRLAARPALVVADPPYGGVTLAAASRGEAAAADESRAVVLRSALGNNRDALASLPPLTASRDEAAAIAAAFPGGTVLLGPRANEAEIRRLARADIGTYGIIHLATHALVDCRAPDRSALVLAGAADAAPGSGEGLLTAREVRLGWRLDADLVTLSSCETGLGRETADDGMLSFADAFLAAGARNVVSSLWKVEDRATAQLMAWFYEELAGGAEVDAALRTAQLRLRDHVTAGGTHPWAAPWAWAGFMAYGGATAP